MFAICILCIERVIKGTMFQGGFQGSLALLIPAATLKIGEEERARAEDVGEEKRKGFKHN